MFGQTSGLMTCIRDPGLRFAGYVPYFVGHHFLLRTCFWFHAAFCAVLRVLPAVYVNTILVVIVHVFFYCRGRRGCGGPDKRMDGLRLGPGFVCCLPYLLDTTFCTFCCIFVSLACGRQQCEKIRKVRVSPH